jgi:hypothetical protein
MSPISSMSNAPAMFLILNGTFENANVNSQKLCRYEIEENTITVIDTLIIFKLIIHHVGKSFKLKLLFFFSMSWIKFIAPGDRFDTAGLVAIIGCVTMGYICFTILLYYDGLFFKGYIIPVPHTRVIRFYTYS